MCFSTVSDFVKEGILFWPPVTANFNVRTLFCVTQHSWSQTQHQQPLEKLFLSCSILDYIKVTFLGEM